jgi:alpha-galactosidase
MLETPRSNLSFTAAGLNHFSVLLDVSYKDTGKDAYPDVRRRAPAYFEHAPSVVEILAQQAGSQPLPRPKRKWADRSLSIEILERFGHLPITDDSHFGEYIHWAHEVADHQGILDFYTWYKQWSMQKVSETIITETSEEEGWNAISIIEGIVANTGHAEPAVNIPNEGLIDNLPRDLVVEVPAIVDQDGIHGVKLGALPKGIAGLLNNQVATMDLTVEAVLTGSRDIALQALLVDPIVDSVWAAEKTLDTILELQKPYLGYLK